MICGEFENYVRVIRYKSAALREMRTAAAASSETMERFLEKCCDIDR
jgi:hypothetical protein